MKDSITAAEFAGVVEQFAPLAAAYDWDNSGYNVCCHDRIQKVLVALDLTMPVLAEAKAGGHHPDASPGAVSRGKAALAGTPGGFSGHAGDPAGLQHLLCAHLI